MTQTPRYILAPYLPTAPDVVDRMVRLAGVGASDFVLDVGCGDGRLAIAAACSGRARALGVDIEPYWVEQARANASAAGVSHLTQFEHCDALSLDPHPATVVFIYLVEWSTELVSRHLLAHCAPGTRVVSNSFSFPTPFETTADTFIDHSGHPRSIHLWIVPSSPLPPTPSAVA